MILLKDRLNELSELIDRLAHARYDAGYYADVGGSAYTISLNEATEIRLEITKVIREIQAEYEVLDNV